MPQESLQRLRKYHFSVLRMQGHTSVVYVDNCYLEGDSCGSYLKNVNDTTKCYEHQVLPQIQSLIYLGFIINFKDMALKLTKEKKQVIMTFIVPVHWQYSCQLPSCAFRTIISQRAETEIAGLKRHRQNYDAEIELTNEACCELVQWKLNIKNSLQDLVIPTPDITMFIDASKTDWPQEMGITHLEVRRQNMKECILMYLRLNLRLPVQAFAHTAIIEARSISELCQRALE